MTDFWTSLYQPSARRTGGTPVGGGEGGMRTASECVMGLERLVRGWAGKHHERRVPPTPVGRFPAGLRIMARERSQGSRHPPADSYLRRGPSENSSEARRVGSIRTVEPFFPKVGPRNPFPNGSHLGAPLQSDASRLVSSFCK